MPHFYPTQILQCCLLCNVRPEEERKIVYIEQEIKVACDFEPISLSDFIQPTLEQGYFRDNSSNFRIFISAIVFKRKYKKKQQLP